MYRFFYHKNNRYLLKVSNFFLFLTIIFSSLLTKTVHPREISHDIPIFINPNSPIANLRSSPVRSIRFLTTADFPPFNFLGPAGRIEGFNIGIAREICLEIKVRCTIQIVEWKDLDKFLESGQGDAIIAGLAQSRQNRERLVFTRPYLRFPARFFAKSAPAKSSASRSAFGDLTIGVQENTAHHGFLTQYFFENEIVLFENQEALRQAVLKGDVDIGFADGVQTSFWLQSASAKNCCRFVGGPYLHSQYFGHGLSIAVLRDREDLKETLNDGLVQLTKNGKYTELYLKYFPVNFFKTQPLSGGSL